MARQTNRRSTGRKTTRRKSSKSKSASRGAFLGIGLIALLIGLITVSVMTITNNREKGSKEEQVVTIIPANKGESKKEQKESTKVVSVPKKEEKKKEREEKPKKEEKQVAQKEDKKEKVKEQEEQLSNENISDLIRLVLYDHEISRSSVTERKKKKGILKNENGPAVPVSTIGRYSSQWNNTTKRMLIPFPKSTHAFLPSAS